MPLTSKSATHIAKRGETWDSIAFEWYLEEREAATILKANPGMAHIVSFEGGEKIRVPIIEKANTPSTLAPWRR